MHRGAAFLTTMAIAVSGSFALADVEACRVRCPDGTWVNTCSPDYGSCAPEPAPPVWSPPDYCERHPERCQDQFQQPPSQLSLHLQTFSHQLSSFGQYLDVSAYRTLPDPATDTELSARLDNFYAFAYGKFLNFSREVDNARGRASTLEIDNRSLRESIRDYERKAAEQRRTNATLESDATSAEAKLRKLESQGNQLAKAALAAYRNAELHGALIAYFDVFGRDPNFLRGELYGPKLRAFVDGWDTSIANAQVMPAMPAAPWVTAPQPPVIAADRALDPMVYLTATASIDAKLAEVAALDGRFRRLYDDRNAANDRIAVLAPEYADLRASNGRALTALDGLKFDATTLRGRLSHAQQYMPVAERNRDAAARALATETIVALAKAQATREVKLAVDRLLGVTGIASSIPTSKDDLVLLAAKAGQRILIPVTGYKAQWDAFFKAQRQTATLIDRSEGYLLEAARLGARGTPEETKRHMTSIFRSVDAEAAQYTVTVGLSDLPEGERGLFEKALDKFIKGRQFQE